MDCTRNRSKQFVYVLSLYCVLPLAAALKVLHLSPARYHAWIRAEQGCVLTDQPSCPRSIPHRLRPEEVGTIRELVTSTDHRHMSIRALALHAQRVGDRWSTLSAAANGRIRRARSTAWSTVCLALPSGSRARL